MQHSKTCFCLILHFFCLCFYRYFSYEHFYVIYCKFWELDTDHDFLIDKENLIKYGNHALTYRIVDRIFSQVCVIQRMLLCLDWTSFWAEINYLLIIALYNSSPYNFNASMLPQIPRKFTSKVDGKMGYEDFVYFILSEEDKSSEPSLEYWYVYP